MYTETINEDRAEWARIGLEAFGEQTRQVSQATGLTIDDVSNGDFFGEIAGDFLCNLAHLAHQHGHDLESIFTYAMEVFRDELADEADE